MVIVPGADACDLYLSEPDKFKEALGVLIQNAATPGKPPAFEHPLLHEEHLLRRIVEEVQAQGVVGRKS